MAAAQAVAALNTVAALTLPSLIESTREAATQFLRSWTAAKTRRGVPAGHRMVEYIARDVAAVIRAALAPPDVADEADDDAASVHSAASGGSGASAHPAAPAAPDLAGDDDAWLALDDEATELLIREHLCGETVRVLLKRLRTLKARTLDDVPAYNQSWLETRRLLAGREGKFDRAARMAYASGLPSALASIVREDHIAGKSPTPQQLTAAALREARLVAHYSVREARDEEKPARHPPTPSAKAAVPGPHGAGKGRRSEGLWCEYHRSKTHSSAECRAAAAGKAGPAAKGDSKAASPTKTKPRRPGPARDSKARRGETSATNAA
ncbi:MAG: hypothetical protein QG597_2387, partial [Actinomycetota bacterium]|nr:hypothetical protein [Actinomycetota bacterium]